VLEELHVRNLALIEEVWLEFGPGMTALTGETGAGKTALLGALKLLMGERADSGSVRAGTSEALVEGRFLRGTEELVARRRVGADGRSRCTLGGEMATVGALAAEVGPLVDLHGQHEHQALLTPATHARYLDRWAGSKVHGARDAYVAALEAYREAVRARDDLSARAADAARQADYLRFVADEIGRVAPVAGEDDALRARLPALRHAEKLVAAADAAHRALHAEGGAEDSAASALAALERASGLDPALDALAERVSEAAVLLEDASALVRSYRDGVERDPSALDEVESRLAALSGLERKYGPTLETVIRTHDDAVVALEALDAGERGMERADAIVASRELALRTAADALVRVRTTAAPGFSDAVNAAAEDLSMGGARVDVLLTDLAFESWTLEGPHRVEFVFSPSPSTPPRPLSRIASGGELSRVMLALKGVLGAADDVPVLVFDEIDAGIGGATAHAVGRRLSELSATHQVIVVTHLAQVASYADAQLVVRKDLVDGEAVTAVERVEGEARIAEIARMLSGEGTAASREHARELLER